MCLHFAENEIEETSFLTLTIDDLRTLLPGKIGPQKKIQTEVTRLNKGECIVLTEAQYSEAESSNQTQLEQTICSSVLSAQNAVLTSLHCFKCSSGFRDAKSLWEYFKVLHKISIRSSNFLCLGCKSKFDITSSFKMHILKCGNYSKNDFDPFRDVQQDSVENEMDVNVDTPIDSHSLTSLNSVETEFESKNQNATHITVNYGFLQT